MIKKIIGLILFGLFEKSITYHVANKRIIDEWGRERIFHGTNMIYKESPWHPNFDKFNYNTSFTDYDIKIISEYGLNFIRLGVMWPGVEPKKGEYNYSYLEVMKNIVDKLERNNISVLIEFHQDALSEYFCGEGIPDWAVNNSDFPFPIALPYNKSGKPTKEKCLSRDWWKYQFSYKAGSVYEELYEDTELFHSFLKYWKVIGETFNHSKNVIGYEIINEPFAGNIEKDPLLMLPKIADKKFLKDFYSRVYKYLWERSYLNSKLFLFESVTWDDFGMGFERAPGENMSNQSVFSYHCYFPPDLSPKQVFDVRMKDLDKLNVAGFLTELGSTHIEEVFENTDNYFQSWSVWQYKSFSGITGDGSMFFYKNGTNATTRDYLNRTYPRAICGRGMYFNFNSNQQ